MVSSADESPLSRYHRSRMTMGRASAIALVVLASSAPSLAHAQQAASCEDSQKRSRTARDAGKLVEARTLLRQCSSESCPSVVREDCAEGLTNVEGRIASVVLSASDVAGTALVDVSVTIDGNEAVQKLDGRPLELDPGEHYFVFHVRDGRKTERRLFLLEREKDIPLAVTIASPATPVGSGQGLSDTELAAGQPRPRAGSKSLRVAGLVTGGAGIAGLLVGTAFGLKATSALAQPHCDAKKVCDPGVIDDAKSAATISTIGFVAGAVLVAGGVTLFLLGRSRDATARINAAPTIGVNGGGLLVREW